MKSSEIAQGAFYCIRAERANFKYFDSVSCKSCMSVLSLTACPHKHAFPCGQTLRSSELGDCWCNKLHLFSLNANTSIAVFVPDHQSGWKVPTESPISDYRCRRHYSQLRWKMYWRIFSTCTMSTSSVLVPYRQDMVQCTCTHYHCKTANFRGLW